MYGLGRDYLVIDKWLLQCYSVFGCTKRNCKELISPASPCRLNKEHSVSQKKK